MELWKDIENYEGYYQVSDLGNVRALYREFIGKDGKWKRYPERQLRFDESTTPHRLSYRRVTLSKDYKTKRILVHRLVAQAFLPNPESKEFVNHIDNNGLNNSLQNLEWVTHAENMIHAQKQGRLFLAQSSGGKKGGRISKQRCLDEVSSLVGNVLGGYLILRLDKPNKHGKVALCVRCVCCGREYTRSKDYILNASHSGCIKCKHKIKI